MARARTEKTGKVKKGRVTKSSAKRKSKPNGKGKAKTTTRHKETRRISIKLYVKERKHPSEEAQVANKTLEVSHENLKPALPSHRLARNIPRPIRDQVYDTDG